MKLNLGAQHDQSKLTFKGTFPSGSSTEINFGDQFDMSAREISILETSNSELSQQLQELMKHARELDTNQNAGGKIVDEVEKFSNQAKKIVTEKKWYSVSAEGLLEAAKSVGQMALPLISSADKVLSILRALKLS
jgi:hypothetical protein